MAEPPEATVVTLDGPAGSGKSTTAREVARRLGYRYLDSGALYRMITHALMAEGVDPDRWPGLTSRELASLHVSAEAGDETLLLRHRGRLLGDAELRCDQVTERVSQVARVPAVRDWLLETQRALGREGRLVADGRDMGTVVFPAAGTKIFLEADLRERARRRLRDHGVQEPGPGRLTEAAHRLASRDSADSQRKASPLRVPEGAHRLDTTDLDFEEQVQRVVALAREAAGER